MKVLLVNQTFYPDLASSAQHLTDLARELKARGAEVTVLCERRSYVDAANLYPRRENLDGIQIIRFAPLAFRKRSKLTRVLNALLSSIGFAWKLLTLPRFDKVIALTSPPLLVCVCALFSRRKERGLVYWALDINPDEAFAAGWIRESSVVGKFLNRAHKYALSRSAIIVTLDRFMKERLIARGAEAENIAVVPVWYVPQNLTAVPADENEFRTANNLTGQFVVMYSGNLSICHPIATLLEAAKELVADRTITFLFVGGGPRLREVEEARIQFELPNIVHLPYVPVTDLSRSLSAADLHVVSMGEKFVGIVHPSKVYGVMAVERPYIVLGPSRSAPAESLEQYGYGAQIDHGDRDGLIREILRFKNESELIRVRHAGRIASSRSYNRENLANRVIDLVCGDGIRAAV